MQRTSVRASLLATFSFAALAGIAPASGKLPVPIEGKPLPETSAVVEYYHAAKSLFFITVDAAEMAALDANAASGWTRVSNRAAFFTITEPVTARGENDAMLPAVPVCRYFIPPASHFFSASPAECAAVRNAHPKLVLETDAAFYAWLPDMAGRCPRVATDVGFVSLTPVYRLWHAQGESNHRYVTSTFERASMIEAGWVAEGYGDAGVAMCVAQ